MFELSCAQRIDRSLDISETSAQFDPSRTAPEVEGTSVTVISNAVHCRIARLVDCLYVVAGQIRFVAPRGLGIDVTISVELDSGEPARGPNPDLPGVPTARISDKAECPLGHALCSMALAGSFRLIIPVTASLGKSARRDLGQTIHQ
ncbi:hypothetical protein ACIBU0_11385 [Streptomyces sp. NPDC049627]|uniref:hypothetical protein n=1 Tax=Streptomyces sp. NPDC049627 TaxID=3365595 RepID=UPI00379C3A91